MQVFFYIIIVSIFCILSIFYSNFSVAPYFLILLLSLFFSIIARRNKFFCNTLMLSFIVSSIFVFHFSSAEFQYFFYIIFILYWIKGPIHLLIYLSAMIVAFLYSHYSIILLLLFLYFSKIRLEGPKFSVLILFLFLVFFLESDAFINEVLHNARLNEYESFIRHKIDSLFDIYQPIFNDSTTHSVFLDNINNNPYLGILSSILFIFICYRYLDFYYATSLIFLVSNFPILITSKLIFMFFSYACFYGFNYSRYSVAERN